MAIPGQIPKGMYHDTDTRYNLYEIPSQLDLQARARIETQAQSVACLVDKGSLIQISHNGSTQYCLSHHVPSLAGKLQVMYQEAVREHASEQKRPPAHEQASRSYKGPFSDELSLGIGTAFLIGKQLILTPAHCINKTKLASLRVLFGFQTSASGHVQTNFAERDVYRIESVWKDSLKKGNNDQPIADWAILKLDREVEGREPLSLTTNRPPSLHMPLYMLGHPAGLPLKLTLNGEVQKNSDPHFFEADLDAYAGNSGSPVFANETGDLVGMLVQGNNDYDFSGKHIKLAKISKETIEDFGFEKCHKIVSIEVVKTVLTSSFKMAHSHFSGRIKHLANLKTHLVTLPLSTRVHILYGPGGVGKSELAIAFANNNIEDFSFIWSISCGTEAEEFVGYHALAIGLQVPLDDREDLSSLTLKVNRKLEEHRTKPWLLLFDNLQKPPLLPNRGGSALITSYKRLDIQPFAAGAVGATEVLPLETEEALKLLEDVTQKSLPDCKKLLERVGCYPLTLGQVASYIKHTGIAVEEYIANFQEHCAALSEHGNRSSNSKITLEAAFGMTLKQLSLSARQWLFICSKLNAAMIPLSYLKSWLKGESPAAIITELEEHALLRYNAQDEVFSLHLEFQRILKSVAPPETAPEVLHLLKTMGEDWSFEDVSDWAKNMKQAAKWVPHAKSFVADMQPLPLDNLAASSVLEKLGVWEYTNNQYEKGLEYHGEALKAKRVILPEMHPDIARSLNYLGNCYYFQQNFEKAFDLYQQSFAIRKAILEENHPDIAASLNNLGNCYSKQGKRDTTLQMYTEALKIYRTAFGELHPKVAMCLRNISSLCKGQNGPTETLNKLKEALEISKTVSGDNHPDVAETMYDLGLEYLKQDNYNEALNKHREALQIFRAVFGDNHPKTARCLGKIGLCYARLGNYAEALNKQQQALEILKAVPGDNHRLIAEILSSLGICYYELHNYSQASITFNLALRIFREKPENNQLDMIDCINRLAHCHHDQNNFNEALLLYQEVLAFSLRTNHQGKAATFSNVGICYHGQGRYAEALQNFNEALQLRTDLRENNAEVARILKNIGDSYQAQGNYTEAFTAYNRALTIQRAIFEEHHPFIAATLDKVATCQVLLNQQTQQQANAGYCAIS